MRRVRRTSFGDHAPPADWDSSFAAIVRGEALPAARRPARGQAARSRAPADPGPGAAEEIDALGRRFSGEPAEPLAGPGRQPIDWAAEWTAGLSDRRLIERDAAAADAPPPFEALDWLAPEPRRGGPAARPPLAAERPSGRRQRPARPGSTAWPAGARPALAAAALAGSAGLAIAVLSLLPASPPDDVRDAQVAWVEATPPAPPTAAAQAPVRRPQTVVPAATATARVDTAAPGPLLAALPVPPTSGPLPEPAAAPDVAETGTAVPAGPGPIAGGVAAEPIVVAAAAPAPVDAVAALPLALPAAAGRQLLVPTRAFAPARPVAEPGASPAVAAAPLAPAAGPPGVVAPAPGSPPLARAVADAPEAIAAVEVRPVEGAPGQDLPVVLAASVPLRRQVAELTPAPQPPDPVAAGARGDGLQHGRLVASVQRALRRRGIDAGPADGVAGPRTRAAVRTFQRRIGVTPDGVVDVALLRRLQSGMGRESLASNKTFARGLGDAVSGMINGVGQAIGGLFGVPVRGLPNHAKAAGWDGSRAGAGR
ncbi:Putative peptidoglycan binding domain-containing protein [Tistlia consotensis]|uniref:Putative peptidoglycan binding domain-containing protein n=1 Tax=Tistlia consotensis USBA 355 TaxID=560819 RepID=A0A1Y6BUI3_9PROT|nr:peptidoglycan-binding domain-containing protein [Tistlia consotensis]SMF29469.1 Putative peptidoglycan binding domain-containing protein [Tistlia consotensis USBA 355]SNR91295.1 Putative peptidoglycan binding domain-containing protein [Tistlia consotensis]